MRRLLFNIHLWLGLILGLPLVILGITGSILVFEHELEDFFAPPPQHQLAEGTSRTIGEIIDAAEAVAENSLRLALYRAPESEKPASVMFGKPGEKRPSTTILIDPVSLTVLENPPPPPSIFRTILKLHANLLVEGRTGRQLIGWLGLVMLVLAFSGIVLWWPKQKKKKKNRWLKALTLKKGARGYRLHRDLHGVSAIWLWLVLFIAAFSGVYLAFPDQTAPVIRAIFPARDLRAEVDAVNVQPMEAAHPPISTITALAIEAVPDATITMIRFPSKPEQPYRIGMSAPERTSGPDITVYVDPWKERVELVQDPRTYTIGETLMAWQRAIHGGHGTDWLWWKIALVIVGFLPLLLAITGTWMWLLKRRTKNY